VWKGFSPGNGAKNHCKSSTRASLAGRNLVSFVEITKERLITEKVGQLSFGHQSDQACCMTMMTSQPAARHDNCQPGSLRPGARLPTDRDHALRNSTPRPAAAATGLLHRQLSARSVPSSDLHAQKNPRREGGRRLTIQRREESFAQRRIIALKFKQRRGASN
jgi:hypothetical protein